MKEVSLVIPVYNEDLIIEAEVEAMVGMMQKVLPQVEYEVFLVENGSKDHTREKIAMLITKHPEVRAISLPVASYGRSVKTGILEGNGTYLVLFNIDLWDIVFAQRAVELCKVEGYDIIVGSKLMPGAKDLRPWLRKIITRVFNFVLRLAFGFRGTDTHGMKVLRRESIIPVVKQCITDREIFDTELLLRAQRAGLATTEIPIVCREKRKTTYGIIKRIPRTLKDLIILLFTLSRSR